MRESARGRPTPIGEVMRKEGDEQKGREVLGAKGISMEILHKRLGHTAKSGLERLIRKRMVRGLVEEVKGDLGVCRGVPNGEVK